MEESKVRVQNTEYSWSCTEYLQSTDVRTKPFSNYEIIVRELFANLYAAIVKNIFEVL